MPKPWPYPRWIAHRGAGKLAPENTLAAFRVGANYGYRMFECDAKLSADGVLFLMHDTTLRRTTNAAAVPCGSHSSPSVSRRIAREAPMANWDLSCSSASVGPRVRRVNEPPICSIN